jgi:cyclophilin family peptidyl-prolyl cis-trans isomerase
MHIPVRSYSILVALVIAVLMVSCSESSDDVDAIVSTSVAGTMGAQSNSDATYSPNEVDYWFVFDGLSGVARATAEMYMPEYMNVFQGLTAIGHTELSRESFLAFVQNNQITGISELAVILISNLQDDVDISSNSTLQRITQPNSQANADFGCWIAYSAARKRFGSFVSELGEMPDQCHRWYVEYQVNNLKNDVELSWIEYLSQRLLGVQNLVPPSTDEDKATVGQMLREGDKQRAPMGALDTSKTYTAAFSTDAGDFKILLFDDEAPLTVENFINLTTIGFYDGLMFHRVIQNFMAQTGDPTGTGSGGPGYQFTDEFNKFRRHHKPGILSMANAGSNTNGSQFFITFVATPHLDGKHTVFGEVIEGLDKVLDIAIRDPNTATASGDHIRSIVISVR